MAVAAPDANTRLLELGGGHWARSIPGRLAVARHDHRELGHHRRRLGERTVEVDVIRHLREGIDLVAMLPVWERTKFLDDLGPVIAMPSQVDAALDDFVDVTIETPSYRLADCLSVRFIV